MTECERIINLGGGIHESFLQPETICDFYVDEKRKKIWAIELDLLSHFIFVCNKYNLKYYLIGGSLLGAVRHNGIIPWDDDIDVGMPRKDYDRFVKLNKEFNYPYFLQTPHTDNGYAYSFARLRNSETTCIIPMFQYQGYNHGMYIDIFPYDNWVEEGGEALFQKIHQLAYDNSTYMRISNPHLDEKNLERVKKWPGRNYLEVYDEIQSLASKYMYIETDKVAKVVLASNLSKAVHNKCDYNETLLVDFSFLKVMIPKGYNNILNTYFGSDYMQFPPTDKRNGGHEEAIFDPDKSYKQYLKGIL